MILGVRIMWFKWDWRSCTWKLCNHNGNSGIRTAKYFGCQIFIRYLFGRVWSVQAAVKTPNGCSRLKVNMLTVVDKVGLNNFTQGCSWRPSRNYNWCRIQCHAQVWLFVDVSPLRQELCWLPISFQVQFKMLVINFVVLHGTGPGTCGTVSSWRYPSTQLGLTRWECYRSLPWNVLGSIST